MDNREFNVKAREALESITLRYLVRPPETRGTLAFLAEDQAAYAECRGGEVIPIRKLRGEDLEMPLRTFALDAATAPGTLGIVPLNERVEAVLISLGLKCTIRGAKRTGSTYATARVYTTA